MKIGIKHSLNKISERWKGSALKDESTFHQIAPYIGKIKSSMAKELVTSFSKKGDTIYEPFSGSGSVALESWIAERNIIANDLNPYAAILTRAKLFPYSSLDEAIFELNNVDIEVKPAISKIDLRSVPKWVRDFFHPETLREGIAWCQTLKAKRRYFLLACLLGILHHQRPGFLSYPSCHTVPYLRKKRFPADRYPEMYEYRPLLERLEKKVIRAFRRIPKLNYQIKRKCHMVKSDKLVTEQRANAIITSPPYMRQLSYARDNRLRLWFLGVPDWKTLDDEISPSAEKYFRLCRDCFRLWHKILAPNAFCVLVLGDKFIRHYAMFLPDVIAHIATKEVGGYSVSWKYKETIPNERRIRRGYNGSSSETILVLRKS